MRIHKPGGIYFTQLRSNGDAVFLENEEDRSDFETRLATALTISGARIHAFCWLPKQLLLAIEIGDVRLGKIIQRVTGPFAKAALARRGKNGHLFLHPHRAFLLEGDRLFLELVRYIHRAPLRAHQCTSPLEYPSSSHRAYLGRERIPWLSTSRVLKECAARASSPASGYRLMMERAEADDFLPRLKRSAVGYRRDMTRPATSLRRAAPVDDPWTLDQWVCAVAHRLKVEPSRIRSPSRRRDLSRARALVALRATENGVSLAEVARYLGRDPSTLISGMERYREYDKDLFAEELKQPAKRSSPRGLSVNPRVMQAPLQPIVVTAGVPD